MKHSQGLWFTRVTDSDIDIESETSGADLPGVLICSLKRDEGEAWADEVLANARLIADTPAILAALEAVEWVYKGESRSGKSVYLCPWCTQWKHNGHATDCQRQAALGKAQGLTPATPWRAE